MSIKTKTVKITDAKGVEHKIKLTAQYYSEDGLCVRAGVPAGFVDELRGYNPRRSLAILIGYKGEDGKEGALAEAVRRLPHALAVVFVPQK